MDFQVDRQKRGRFSVGPAGGESRLRAATAGPRQFDSFPLRNATGAIILGHPINTDRDSVAAFEWLSRPSEWEARCLARPAIVAGTCPRGWAIAVAPRHRPAQATGDHLHAGRFGSAAGLSASGQ